MTGLATASGWRKLPEFRSRQCCTFNVEAHVARFLIEVTHDADEFTCARVVKTFLTSGSHFLTHADWGCADGDHRSWVIVDVADKKEAMAVVPPPLRPATRITGLNGFSLDYIEEILKKHSSSST